MKTHIYIFIVIPAIEMQTQHAVKSQHLYCIYISVLLGSFQPPSDIFVTELNNHKYNLQYAIFSLVRFYQFFIIY
jgi:hypothetical protein